MSIDASAAASIIMDNRAFYAFLKREFALNQAAACLRVLGAQAVKQLEAALSDKSNFGMAKSLFMEGREAGFEMDTQDGIESWMRAVMSNPAPVTPRPVARVAARAKKHQRKAARKARKRNR